MKNEKCIPTQAEIDQNIKDLKKMKPKNYFLISTIISLIITLAMIFGIFVPLIYMIKLKVELKDFNLLIIIGIILYFVGYSFFFLKRNGAIVFGEKILKRLKIHEYVTTKEYIGNKKDLLWRHNHYKKLQSEFFEYE